MFKKMNSFSKANMKVLSFLSEHPESKFYGREIAKKAGISVGAANRALNMFLNERLLNREKKGALHFYSANMKNPVIRQLKVLINVIKIEGMVNDMRPISEKIMLFGSCASGTNRYSSDIDVFILTREKRSVEEMLRKHQATLKTKIQALVLETERLTEFRRGNAHLHDQINAGIVLWDAHES